MVVISSKLKASHVVTNMLYTKAISRRAEVKSVTQKSSSRHSYDCNQVEPLNNVATECREIEGNGQNPDSY